jgi:hypothetical protein
MSDQSVGEGLSRLLMDDRPTTTASPAGNMGRVSARGSSGFNPLAIVFFVMLAFVIFFIIPAQINPQYAGQGAMVGMVNPSGENPDVDAQYAEINKGNAQANVFNSAASFGNVFTFLFFLIVVVMVVGLLIVLNRRY